MSCRNGLAADYGYRGLPTFPHALRAHGNDGKPLGATEDGIADSGGMLRGFRRLTPIKAGCRVWALFGFGEGW